MTSQELIKIASQQKKEYLKNFKKQNPNTHWTDKEILMTAKTSLIYSLKDCYSVSLCEAKKAHNAK